MKFETISELNVREGPGPEYSILDTLEEAMIIEEVPIPPTWCPIAMEDEAIGWVSRHYLKEYKESPEAPGPAPTIPPGEPIWIQWARKQIGQREVPGPESNPVIQAWYHLTTLPEYMWTDATAWCAVFINAALMLNNIKTIRSARAFDWLGWGEAISKPQKGDVVIFNFSHVAFYLSDAGDDKINCIGGNQNNEVSLETFNRSAVTAYRRVPS
jgi:uncharacterized protein (TIGR02594 family)